MRKIPTLLFTLFTLIPLSTFAKETDPLEDILEKKKKKKKLQKNHYKNKSNKFI